MGKRCDQRRYQRLHELAALGLLVVACSSNHGVDENRGGTESGGVSGANAAGNGPSAAGSTGVVAGASAIGGSTAGSGSAGVAGQGGAQAGGGSGGGDCGVGSGCDTLGHAEDDCKRVCMAGCSVDPQHPADCPNSCLSVFTEGWFRCPAETTAYVKCVGDMQPLYFCPGFGTSSPCYDEASTMIQCIKDHRQ